MKKIFLLLIVVVCFSACCTQKPVTEIKTDTKTEIKEVVRDTTIYVQADKATVKALLECDSLGNVLIKKVETLQGKLNAKANIHIENNTITADCQCDSMAIYLQLKDKYEKQTTDTIEIKTVMIKKELAWWQKTLMWCGGIALLLIIILVMYNFKKK